MKLKFIVPLLIAAATAFTPALAQNAYPNRVVKLIVPFPPGGASDLIPRMLAPKFQQETGYNLVIENKPGAGGSIAIDLLLRAPADGYTLFLATSAHLAQNPHINLAARYDPVKDFEPIALLGYTANVVFVRTESPIKNLDDLLTAAQTNEITYGSAGTGITAQLAVEMLRQKTKAKFRHIPYKGGAPMLTDVAAGHVQFGTLSIPAAAPLIKSGKLRAIAVTGGQRDSQLPGIPALAEKFPGLQAEGWYSVVAPAGTPKAVSARLHAIFTKLTNLPEIRQEWATNAIEPMGGSQAEFAAYLKKEYERWGPIIKAAGIEKQ